MILSNLKRNGLNNLKECRQGVSRSRRTLFVSLLLALVLLRVQLDVKLESVVIRKDPTEEFLVSTFASLGKKLIPKILSNNSTDVPSVLMSTFLFGKKSANRRFLRLFLDSAERFGVDMVIVGNQAPPYKLPPNVKHIPVTWNELVDRIQTHVFPHKPNCCQDLRKSRNYYKVNDLKPAFASLFPELVQNYDWWGHMDNDMVLGDFRRFFTRDLLSSHDILTAYTNTYTAGPFTLFRNTPTINTLYRRAQRPLEEIFAVGYPNRCFDEWGCGHKQNYESTMAGIVESSIAELGLRWFGFGVYYWDGYCTSQKNGVKRRDFLPCGECIYRRLPDGGQQLLITYLGPQQLQSEVAFCHYQWSKETMEESLDTQLVDAMIDRGAYRMNFLKGFALLNATVPA